MRSVTLPELQGLINKVRDNLLVSNDIVSRTAFPYYHSHPSVPFALAAFKALVTECRQVNAKLADQLGKVKTGSMITDYSEGTFDHRLVGTLTTCAFGIGECSEAVTKLAAELIFAGCGDLVFLTIRLDKSKPGMETSHTILIANMPKPPRSWQPNIPLQKFLKTLPPPAVVADPFLGICFEPSQYPLPLQEYINAYGGSAVLPNPPEHICNFTPKVLTQHYLSHAGKIAKKMKDEHLLSTGQLYDTADLILLPPSDLPVLVQRLNMIGQLKFAAYRNLEFFVQARAPIHNKAQFRQAILLMDQCSKTPVSQFIGFAKNREGEQIIYISNVNQPEVADHLQKILI